MAQDIFSSGLFSSPDDVARAEREKLFGSARSSAQLRGMLTGAAIGGLTGAKNPAVEKAKAQQDIMGAVKWEDPASVKQAAEKLRVVSPEASARLLQYSMGLEEKAFQKQRQIDADLRADEQLEVSKGNLKLRKREFAFRKEAESKGYELLSGDAATSLGFPENSVVQKGPKGGYTVLHKPTSESGITYTTLSEEEIVAERLAEGTVAQKGSNGKLQILQTPEKPKDGITYRTLSDEEVVKNGFTAGSKVQEGSNGKLYVIKEAEPKDEALKITNTVWAEDPESGEIFRIGQGSDNKLYKYVNGEPVVHKGKYQPLAQRVDSSDPVERRESMIDRLNGQVGDTVETLTNSATIDELIDGMGRGDSKAKAQFARIYVRLTGPDSQLSNVEIQRVLGGTDIANRVTNAVSEFFTGEVTQQTVDEFRAVVEPLKKLQRLQLEKDLKLFEQAYSDLGEEYSEEARTVTELVRQKAGLTPTPTQQSIIDEAMQKYGGK